MVESHSFNRRWCLRSMSTLVQLCEAVGSREIEPVRIGQICCRQRQPQEIMLRLRGRCVGSADVHLLLFDTISLYNVSSVAHLRRRRPQRDRHGNINKIVEYANTCPPCQLQRSVVRRFQCFHDIPGLAFHHGYLLGEHGFLKVRVLGEDSTQGHLCRAPPVC